MLFCLLDPDSRGLLECGTGSGSTKLIISIIFVSAEMELYSRFKQCVQYFGRMPGFESETLWPHIQSLQIFLMISASRCKYFWWFIWPGLIAVDNQGGQHLLPGVQLTVGHQSEQWAATLLRSYQYRRHWYAQKLFKEERPVVEPA